MKTKQPPLITRLETAALTLLLKVSEQGSFSREVMSQNNCWTMFDLQKGNQNVLLVCTAA